MPLDQQLIQEEEGPSSPVVYLVAGLQHIARGCVVDAKVSGSGLCTAALIAQDAYSLSRARSIASNISGWAGLSDVRQAVLVSMCYQLGMLADWPGFKTALALGDYDKAADEMLMESPPDPAPTLWHTQTPARCEREAWMMRKNQWLAMGQAPS